MHPTGSRVILICDGHGAGVSFACVCACVAWLRGWCSLISSTPGGEAWSTCIVQSKLGVIDTAGVLFTGFVIHSEAGPTRGYERV